MASELQITTVDKLMVIPNLSRALMSALLRLITNPFTTVKANTLLKDVLFAALRTNLAIVSPATEQWMNATTESTYVSLAKKHGFQPDTTVLNSGLKLHWLGSKTAKKIILYFHGGGYVLSASLGHFEWVFDLQNELAKSHSVSAVFVGYTLAPHGQYPLQLRQAAESLDWLLTTQGKKPSDIMIASDSAGGNMTLSLISHLIHPHPEVTNIISMSEPIAGAILISPWVKFATDDESMTRNATSDMVCPQAANRWSSLFLGSGALDNYNQPVLADANWFKGVDVKVKDILVWGGASEVLIDSIEVIGKKLKEASSSTEVVIQPGAAHEEFIIDRVLGFTEKAEGTKLIESWIAARW